MIPVFRYGKIYNYDEVYGNNSWGNEQYLIASSLYATLRHMNVSEDEAYSLSFMYVSQMYDPELDFPQQYKKKLESIFNLLEKA